MWKWRSSSTRSRWANNFRIGPFYTLRKLIQLLLNKKLVGHRAGLDVSE
jgi:hypothetical protein